MKILDPLQGFIRTSNHFLVHLALLIAQPICMAYWIEYNCEESSTASGGHRLLGGGAAAAPSQSVPTDSSESNHAVHTQAYVLTDSLKYQWMKVHLICLILEFLSRVFLKLSLNEMSKVCKLVSIPIYYFEIFVTHYDQLNELAGASQFQLLCGDLKQDLYLMWGHLELLIFYAYLFSCVLFLLAAQIWKVNKQNKSQVSACQQLSGDTLEKYQNVQVVFSLRTYELITTVAVLVSQKQDQLSAHNQYFHAGVMIICYGVITTLQAVCIFVDVELWFQSVLLVTMWVFRATFIAVAAYYLFQLKGLQFLLGFWIITEFVFFGIITIYEAWNALAVKLEPIKQKDNLVTNDDYQKHLPDITIEVNQSDRETNLKPTSSEPSSNEKDKSKVIPQKLIVNHEQKDSLEMSEIQANTLREMEQLVQEELARDIQQKFEGGEIETSTLQSVSQEISPRSDDGTHKTVEISEDSYVMAFLSYKKDVVAHNQITKASQGRHFYSALWIFLIEMTIIVVVFKVMVYDKEGAFFISTSGVEILVTRFCMSMLLHMELINELKQGLNLIEYVNTHPDEFETTMEPFLIGLMQFVGGLIAELTNQFMLATRDDVSMCITFFVAFHVLTAIDNIYAESLSDPTLKEACEEPLKFKMRAKDIKFKDRQFGQQIIRVFFVVMNFFNAGVYYYWTPFLVNFLPYLRPGVSLKAAH